MAQAELGRVQHLPVRPLDHGLGAPAVQVMHALDPGVVAVQFERVRRFVGQIGDPRQRVLHPIGQLVGLDAGFQADITSAADEMLLVQLLQQIELTPLLIWRIKQVAQVYFIVKFGNNFPYFNAG